MHGVVEHHPSLYRLKVLNIFRPDRLTASRYAPDRRLNTHRVGTHSPRQTQPMNHTHSRFQCTLPETGVLSTFPIQRMIPDDLCRGWNLRYTPGTRARFIGWNSGNIVSAV